MPLTLELPPQLGEELREEAEKAGVTPQEHAMLLLYLATALLQEESSTRFQEAVRQFISQHLLDADQVSSVFGELVARCVEASSNGADIPQALRDDLQAWRNWYVHQRGTAGEPRPSAGKGGHRRLSAMGKYAHIPGTSYDFIREKQAEIDHEERRNR